MAKKRKELSHALAESLKKEFELHRDHRKEMDVVTNDNSNLKQELSTIKLALMHPPKYQVEQNIGNYKIMGIKPSFAIQVAPVLKSWAGPAIDIMLGKSFSLPFYGAIQAVEDMPWEYLVTDETGNELTKTESELNNALEAKEKANAGMN
jgi:hypothetical protein